MSVIIGRALPDVRDGLKPANRRVLYGMSEMGLQPGRAYKKCAARGRRRHGQVPPARRRRDLRHPRAHGPDLSNMRYPLIDGQGNFGSVDGDPAGGHALHRVPPQRMGAAMLTDIDKETVDFQPNYDDESSEPMVLPDARSRTCWSTASAGIAVGMATNIPPHNLGEVVDGHHLPDREPGPRRPTSGWRRDGASFPAPTSPPPASSAAAPASGRPIATGRGRHRHARARGDRGRAKGRQGVDRRHRDPLPGEQGAAHRAASPSWSRDKKIEGIADMRDESDRQGMRIVVDVRRASRRQVVLNNLYKYTAAAGHVRRDHAGHRRRPAAVLTLRSAASSSSTPPRRGPPAHALRARKAEARGPTSSRAYSSPSTTSTRSSPLIRGGRRRRAGARQDRPACARSSAL